jgi:RHS repeat-associated protein
MKELFSHNPNSALGTATNETAMVGSEVHTLTRHLDEHHRLASLSVGAAQVHYAYDAENRLANVSNDVFAVSYQYTTDGLDAGYAVTLTNGVVLVRALTRDTYRRGLIATITNSVDGVAVNPLVYNYDVLNRATARNTDTFGYNTRSEVTNATLNAIDYTYAYDDIGNHTASSANSVSTIYDANALNQYSEISVPSVPSVDNLSYDRDGNLLTNDVWSYTYDAENRMTSAYSNSLCVVSNAYDHASRRVVKVTPTAMHTFMYDGWNLIQETVQNQQSTITNHYVWGRDLSGSLQGAGGVGGLLAVLQNGSWYFPFFDVNGNITVYVDEQGSVVASYAYDPFGATIAQSGSMADAFAHRFSTKYFDSETGLYYYGYRFYSPDLHRWLNRDPSGENSELNLYETCKNNCVNGWDYLGLWVLNLVSNNTTDDDALMWKVLSKIEGSTTVSGIASIDGLFAIVEQQFILHHGEAITDCRYMLFPALAAWFSVW